MNNSYDIFLSYHSAERSAVKTIAAKLQSLGINPFLDKWNLKPGQPWIAEIEDALHSTRAFGTFIGRTGLGPVQVAEMRAALHRMFRDKGFPVIPILLPGADPAKKNRLPAFLAQQTWVDFRNGLDNKEELERFIAQIKPKKNNTIITTGYNTNIKKIDKAQLLRTLVKLEGEDLVYLGEISGIRRSEITFDGVKTIAVSLVNRAEILGLLEELQTNLILEYPAVAQQGGLVI